MADFVAMLATMGGGTAIKEINTGIAEVVQSVMKTGKGGEITLKLKIAKNGDSGLKIDHSVTTKEPQPSVGSSLYWVDDSGNIVRNDPRQGEMFREARDDQERERA